MKGKTSRRALLVAGCAALSLLPPVSAVAGGMEPETTVSAPSLATVLFDGKDLDAWRSCQGGPAKWVVRNGYMEVVPKSGNICTQEKFNDFQLHVEFWLPYMPEAKGQARANSGVYLQGRYEVQVLDSYGLESKDDDCGAIYGVAAPLRNACRKPETWQSYDIAFRAPRFDRAGQLREPGYVTVFQNGVMIQNNQRFSNPTRAALEGNPTGPGPIMLQDHDNTVRYRNTWIVPVK